MATEGKRCGKCGVEKPLAEFSKGNHKKDGLQYQCKECNRKYYAENREHKTEYRREYYAENREREAERMRGYYAENRERIAEWGRRYNAENREHKAAYRREWRAENREREAEMGRKWYAENKERHAERMREWRAENGEIVRVAGHRRRARERELPCDWTKADMTHALRIFDNKCAACGTGLLLEAVHWDHVIPVSDPRPDNPGTVPGNMVPMCDRCNQSKHTADYRTWFKRHGYNIKAFERKLELCKLTVDRDKIAV